MAEVTRQMAGNYHVSGTGRSTMFRRKNPSLTSDSSESVELSATVVSNGMTFWVKDDKGRQIGVSVPMDFVEGIIEAKKKVDERI